MSVDRPGAHSAVQVTMCGITSVNWQATTTWVLTKQHSPAGRPQAHHGRCGSTLEGPAGKFALTRTSDVYALPVDNVDKPCAMGAMGRMTEEELAHLRFNHCISAHKLAILSNSGARGIIKGLKAEDWKCQIYQHANIRRSPAAPAATGSDPFDMSLDLIDMTSIPTIGGMRYCSIFLVRKTRFAYTFLHEKKDEFPAILDNLMARCDPAQRPKILMCDGAGEYDSQEFRTVLAKYPGVTVRRSNAHEQSANGMAEKMVDRIGRMLPAGARPQ